MPSLPITATCSPGRLRAIVRHHVRALAADPALAAQLPPLLAWGPPGVGKSTVIRSVCAEEGIGFLDIRLAQREPVDLRGLPVPRGDSVQWLLSSDWPRDPASRGVILFDELTAADRTLQVAAYEILLDRRLGELYRVPDGWYLCAAGNRSGDRAAATTLSSALANRFLHLEIVPDLGEWVAWAQRAGVHPAVIAFLRFKPAAFLDTSGNLERGWPSPRSWERVGRELSLAERAGLDEATIRLLVAGLVGLGAAHEFLALRSWSGVADAERMLRGEAAVEIPERADRRFALCAALVHHLWRMDDRARAIALFVHIGTKLPSDAAAMVMLDAMRAGPPEAGQWLTQHPGFPAWEKLHGRAFAAGLPAANAMADAILTEPG